MRYLQKLCIVCSLLIVFIISGCYTQLMTPQDYIKIRKAQSLSPSPRADNSYSINYHQSCTSCHSVAELNERAEELENYGVQIVHDGVLLSSRQWLKESPNYVDFPYGDQGPIYWPTPQYQIDPWWAPPASAVTITSSPSTTNGAGGKIRTDGSSRDGNTNSDRRDPISAPTYTQPSTPVGGTTSTTVAPAPAVTITPAPSTQPAQTNDGGRTRDSGSNGSTTTTKTRSDGSSRDSSDRSRPKIISRGNL